MFLLSFFVSSWMERNILPNIINIEIRTNQFHMKYSINQRKNAVDSLEQTGLHQAQVQMKDQIQHSTVKWNNIHKIQTRLVFFEQEHTWLLEQHSCQIQNLVKNTRVQRNVKGVQTTHVSKGISPLPDWVVEADLIKGLSDSIILEKEGRFHGSLQIAQVMRIKYAKFWDRSRNQRSRLTLPSSFQLMKLFEDPDPLVFQAF